MIKKKTRSIVIAGDLTLRIGDTVFSKGNNGAQFYRVEHINTRTKAVSLVCWTFNIPSNRNRAMDTFEVPYDELEGLLTHDYHKSANYLNK